MPTYNDGLGYNFNNAAYPAHTQWREGIVETVINIADIVAARSAAGAVALAAGDVLELLQLPAQCLVLATGVAIEEVGDAALTVAIGDGADPDGFITAKAADALADFCSVGGGGIFAAGKYYSAADTLDITFAGAVPTTGIVRVWAKVVDGAGAYPIGLVDEAR